LYGVQESSDTSCANAIDYINRSVSVDGGDNGPSKQSNPQKYLEEGYLETEKKVILDYILYPASS
jgi:hypothetical protein